MFLLDNNQVLFVCTFWKMKKLNLFFTSSTNITFIIIIKSQYTQAVASLYFYSDHNGPLPYLHLNYCPKAAILDSESVSRAAMPHSFNSVV